MNSRQKRRKNHILTMVTRRIEKSLNKNKETIISNFFSDTPLEKELRIRVIASGSYGDHTYGPWDGTNYES